MGSSAARVTLFALLGLTALGCGAAMVPPEPAEVAEEPPNLIASLRLEEAPDVVRVPQTRISLAIFDEDSEAVQVHEVEIAAGACSPRRPRGEALLLAGCWWAGSGAVYTVTREGDDLVVSRRYEEESVGEGPAPELPLDEVARVTLPAGANVRAL